MPSRWTTPAVAFLFAATAATLHAAPIPTLGDAQGEYGAGRYRQCLNKIADRMTDTRAKIPPEERYELLVLRGESLLRVNQQRSAADAFECAARVFRVRGDLYKYAVARATAILIRSAKDLRYTPNSSGGEAIDVVSPESRQQAMAALLEDRLAELTPKIQDALASNTLEPLQALLPAAGDAYAIEMASTHANQRTAPLAKSVGERARILVADELDRIADRLEQLNALASGPKDAAADSANIGRRGLTDPERQELQTLLTAVRKQEATAQHGRQIARRIGGNAQNWDALLADCTEARSLIDSLAPKK